MSKKNFIVLSDSGANACSHDEYDTFEEAQKGATRSAESTSMKIEFAIYQKVAVTETIPLKSLIRDIPLQLHVPQQTTGEE